MRFQQVHGGNGCSLPIEVHHSNSSEYETDNNTPLNVRFQQVHEGKLTDVDATKIWMWWMYHSMVHFLAHLKVI